MSESNEPESELAKNTRLAKQYFNDKDYTKAFEYSQKADQTDSEIQHNLGDIFYFGLGIGQDYAKAFELFQASAKQGNPQTQFNLGIMYHTGQGVEQDDIEAFQWYQKAAEQGSPQAQFNLGSMYNAGEGVKQNDEEALKWTLEAAKQNIPQAQFNLGIIYEQGKGVVEDSIESFKWYYKAAKQGIPQAQFNLGNMYRTGQGVKQDYVEALQWHQKAAKQGDSQSQFELGMMYRTGQGVEQNNTEAFKWFQEAAEQNDSHAQYNIGYMYHAGIGIEQDDIEALKWYQKAEKQGIAYAQVAIGLLFLEKGKKWDINEAEKWLHLAIDSGESTVVHNCLSETHERYEDKGDSNSATEIVGLIHRLIAYNPIVNSPWIIYIPLNEEIKRRYKDLNEETLNAIQHLQSRCIRLFNYLSQPPTDDYLWKYTSQASLQKISDSKCLWLHSALDQNDPDEGCFLYEALSLMGDNKPLQDKMGDLYTIISSRKNPCETLGEADLFPPTLTFISSFSDAEDHLPMWNSSYADNCNGCAIGIRHHRFKTYKDTDSLFMNTAIKEMYSILLKDGNPLPPDKPEPESDDQLKENVSLNTLSLFKILYLPRHHNQSKNLQKDVEGIKRFDAIQSAIENLIKVYPEMPTSWIHAYLFPLTHLIKSEDYRHESEYRILCFMNHIDPKNKTLVKGSKYLYVETEQFLFNKRDEEKVYIGPAVTPFDQTKIQQVFERNVGMIFPLIPSTIKYRDTKSPPIVIH